MIHWAWLILAVAGGFATAAVMFLGLLAPTRADPYEQEDGDLVEIEESDR